MGKATSSSDLLPEALCEMYFDMATDKEKNVKAKKRDMSDQVIDWMMGFAMYTATGQLLSHTSSPSRRLSCLHIILMPVRASRQQLAEIQPTLVTANPQLPCHKVEQDIWLMSGIQMHAFSFQSPLTVVGVHPHKMKRRNGVPPFSVEPSAWPKEFCNHTCHDTYSSMYIACSVQ